MNQKQKDAIRTFMTYFWMGLMLLVGMSHPDVGWLRAMGLTFVILGPCLAILAALLFRAANRRASYRH